LTAQDAYKELLLFGYYLSYKTATNILKPMGFHAEIKKKKSFISHKNRLKRYNWAKKHQHWTVNEEDN
jgi:hypothetical protein